MAEADVDRAGRVAAALHQRGDMVGGLPRRLGGLQFDGDGVEMHAVEHARDGFRHRPAGRSHRRRPSPRTPASARSRRSAVRAAPRRWRWPDRDDRRGPAPPRGRAAMRPDGHPPRGRTAARSGCRRRSWLISRSNGRSFSAARTSFSQSSRLAGGKSAADERSSVIEPKCHGPARRANAALPSFQARSAPAASPCRRARENRS